MGRLCRRDNLFAGRRGGLSTPAACRSPAGGGRFRPGTALIELAMVLPLLLLLTLGVIHYGWIFLKAEQLTSAARNGARIGARKGSTNTMVQDAISDVMVASRMGDTGWTWSAVPADVSSLNKGDILEVKVTVPTSDIVIVNVTFLPTPPQLVAAVDMAKED